MHNNLSVIMYHYIRKKSDSFYNGFNYLDLKKFEKQITYFKKNYNILSPDKAKSYINSKKKGGKFLWLTFDDGYYDHYQYVRPILKKNNIKASFFPITSCLVDKNINEANIAHILISKVKNKTELLNYIKKLYVKFECFKNIKDLNTYLDNINLNKKFDNKIISSIKRLLQREANYYIRKKIIEELKKKYRYFKVKNINKFYMNINQIKKLYEDGHEIGLHSHTHQWLSHTGKNDQKKDILNNIKFLKKINVYKKNTTFCFPYGAYDENTLSILNKNKINISLTSTYFKETRKVGQLFLIPRINCRDIP